MTAIACITKARSILEAFHVLEEMKSGFASWLCMSIKNELAFDWVDFDTELMVQVHMYLSSAAFANLLTFLEHLKRLFEANNL